MHPCDPADSYTPAEFRAAVAPPPRRPPPVDEIVPVALDDEQSKRCVVLRAAIERAGEPEQADAARYAYGAMMLTTYRVDAAIEVLEPLVVADRGPLSAKGAELFVQSLLARVRTAADEESALRALVSWMLRLPEMELYGLPEAEPLRDLTAIVHPKALYKLAESRAEREDYRACARLYLQVYELGLGYEEDGLYNAAACTEFLGETAEAERLFRKLVAEMPDSHLAARVRARFQIPQPP